MAIKQPYCRFIIHIYLPYPLHQLRRGIQETSRSEARYLACIELKAPLQLGRCCPRTPGWSDRRRHGRRCSEPGRQCCGRRRCGLTCRSPRRLAGKPPPRQLTG
ncbi:hypothetical protein AMECASPLE_030177 [Ameca splendens]|uniref:Uncharacterized protein n=1 Tax=Ameca splendens TaxID=208324 RepID=A0ABV0Z4Q4_9TELE